MSSEIGNKGLLRSVAEFLKVLDSKSFANRLKTDVVVPVIDIGRGSFAGYPSANPEVIGPNSVNVGGTSELDIPAIYTPQLNGEACDGRVLAFKIVIAAPIAAAAADNINIRCYYGYGESSPDILYLRPFDRQDNAAAYTRAFALGGCQTLVGATSGRPFASGWDGIVPAGAYFGAQIWLQAGTFPAGTEIEYSLFAINAPKGRLSM
jgi:hypothetical protein